jgi:anaerobic selenocysteine-containing dehydrogenase
MLELGDAMMMKELLALHAEGAEEKSDPTFPLRLVCRRSNNFMNSVGQSLPVLSGDQVHTPAFMHSRDLIALGIEVGSLITVSSQHGYMLARVMADDKLREGLVSVVHGFGAPMSQGDPQSELSLGSVSRLVNMDERDPISGIPRMSALPVSVKKFSFEALEPRFS